MAFTSNVTGCKTHLGDTFWSEETDRVCRRAVISARLCSNAATRLAFNGRTGREGRQEREQTGMSHRLGRFSRSRHIEQMTLWLLARRDGGRRWEIGDGDGDGGDWAAAGWMRSEMKEDDGVMQVRGGCVWRWGRGANLITLLEHVRPTGEDV